MFQIQQGSASWRKPCYNILMNRCIRDPYVQWCERLSPSVDLAGQSTRLHYLPCAGRFLCTYRPNSRSDCNPIFRIIVWFYCFVNYKLKGSTFLLVFTFVFYPPLPPPGRGFILCYSLLLSCAFYLLSFTFVPA